MDEWEDHGAFARPLDDLAAMEEMLAALDVVTVKQGVGCLRHSGRRDLASRLRKAATGRNVLAHPDGRLAADLKELARFNGAADSNEGSALHLQEHTTHSAWHEASISPSDVSVWEGKPPEQFLQEYPERLRMRQELKDFFYSR